MHFLSVNAASLLPVFHNTNYIILAPTGVIEAQMASVPMKNVIQLKQDLITHYHNYCQDYAFIVMYMAIHSMLEQTLT